MCSRLIYHARLSDARKIRGQNKKVKIRVSTISDWPIGVRLRSRDESMLVSEVVHRKQIKRAESPELDTILGLSSLSKANSHC